MVGVAADANPESHDGPTEADLTALRSFAAALTEGILAALPGWVEGSVERLLVAYRGAATPEELARARDAGRQAAAEVGAKVQALLAADIDDQRTNPLALVRSAVPYPTGVLREAGVPPVVRDGDAERRFPDDDYDLTPGAFSDLDPSLHEVGMRWGAAKAHVFLARRRAEQRV